MRVQPIACLSDNYAYLLVCPETNEAAIVDVSEPGPVLRATERAEGVKVVAILSTHHHPDHVGGNEEVKAKLGIARVYGHESDRARIPGITDGLREGDTFAIGKLQVRALHIPGHTLGAVAYVVTHGSEQVVFTGDTLFVAGCGRMFEGTPEMMHASLSKLAALDPATKVYCGHEYTQANLKFAAHVEPSNADIEAARARAADLREQGTPTVPSTIGAELATNPFLRVGSEEIRRTVGVAAGASPAQAFGAIRAAKDTFR